MLKLFGMYLGAYLNMSDHSKELEVGGVIGG